MEKIMKQWPHILAAAVSASLMMLAPAHADDPTHDAFTYQGQLRENGVPVTEAVDLKFRLYNAAVAGEQVGDELVAGGYDGFDDDGRFTIDLAFGKGVFDGTALWLEIEVNGVTLSPRQPIMPTPYSVRALNVATVTDGALAGTYTNPLTLNNAGNEFTGAFAGSGAGLTGLNASNISTGTLGSTLLDGSYTNALTFNNAGNQFTGAFAGSGAGLTGLNANNIASGNLSSLRLPTGGLWNLNGTLNIANATMFIDPVNKRIGIGTTSVNSPLRVLSSDPAMSAEFVNTASSGVAAGVRASTNSTSGRAVYGIAQFGGGTGVYGLTTSDSGHAIQASSLSTTGVTYGVRSTVSSPDGYAGYFVGGRNYFGGNVGIGTLDPQELLHLRGGIGTSWRVERIDGAQLRGIANLSDAAIGTANAAALRLLTNNTVRMNITPAGNVGIGTSGPSARLHVVGDLRIQDGTQAAGRVLTSDALGNASWQAAPPTYQVGDFAHGGVVFYVEPCGTRGLVAAKEDQSDGVRWHAGTWGTTQAKGDGPYAGKTNTAIIISALVAIGDDFNTYAARICNELQITEGGQTYGDWYLPSREELNQMWLNKAAIDATAIANGGSAFANGFYWSSTEVNSGLSMVQRFQDGFQLDWFKDESEHVRAVRAF